jgi:NADH-quinone oxidoreductase subunit N
LLVAESIQKKATGCCTAPSRDQLGGAIRLNCCSGTSTTWVRVILADNYAVFFNIAICGSALLTVLLSTGTAGRDRLPEGEYYALLLFSTVGMMMMGATRDLLIIFLGLEIMSLGVYVLTGLKRDSEAGAEAAFKYFVLGAFSSAFFLYGIALTRSGGRRRRLTDGHARRHGGASRTSLSCSR